MGTNYQLLKEGVGHYDPSVIMPCGVIQIVVSWHFRLSLMPKLS